MTHTLGFRYPKQMAYNDVAEGGAGTTDGDIANQSQQFGGGRQITFFEDPRRMIVAPGRYSNVRKVVFHVGFRSYSGAQSLALGVMPSSDSNVARSIATMTLAQNAMAGGSTAVMPRATPAASSFIGYDKFGDSITIPTGQADGDVAMATVEFDRLDLDPEVQDFFNDWDTIAALGDNVYLSYFPIIDKNTAGVDIDVGGLGMTVVQQPTTTNRTNTWHLINIGWASNPLVASTSYQNPESPMRWTYHANHWDKITEVNAFCYGVPNQTGGGITVKLSERAGASDVSGTTIFEDTYSGMNGTNLAYIKTRDFLADLQDGFTYAIDTKFTGTVGANARFFMAWLEVKQTKFTRTASYFDVQTSLDTQPKDPGAGLWAETTPTGCLFDPQWFTGFTDDDILHRGIYFMQLRRTAGHTNTQLIRSDTNLVSNDDNDSGSGATGFRSGTAVNISPSHATALTLVRDYSEQTLTGNDPIDQAGQRRLALGMPNPDNWSNDQNGPIGIFYAYMVPEEEVQELGPLFDLDAFDPEGCASTSAGLGDPGLLIITNGSTIPQKYDPQAGVIQDAGVPTPFEGEVPSSAVANVALGLAAGNYAYRYTFRNCCTGKESDPNPEDIAVDTSGASPAAQVTLSFAGVRIPGDDQICEICVYRTVEGGAFPVMAKVGCFDPSVTTVFVDVVEDDDLDFINDPLSILNAPMPCVPYIVEHQNRIFGAGDIPALSPAGTVTVVNGSNIVEGDFDTQWDRCLEGKYIQIEGDCRPYEIERVLPPEEGTSPPIGRLKLVDDYEGSNQTGALYTICGRPNRLYYCEPFEPECWPVVNFIDVDPGDGDRITGLASNFGRLVICKRNRSYVMGYRDVPALEVSSPQLVSNDVGCVGPRTFAQAEVGTIWMADRGLALYDGRAVQHVPESVEANDIFVNPDNPRFVRRDRNGRCIDAVGVYYPRAEQYLLLLPTVQTTRGCNLMLVWDVKGRNITLCEFKCHEFQSMVVAKDQEGIERIYLGDTNGFVWLYDIGNTDGVGTPGNTGTVRGTISSAGVDGFGASFFSDSTATFIEGGLPELAGLSGVAGLSGAFLEDELGLAGACVFVRPPGGEWLSRAVFASSRTRIWVTPSWGADQPEAGWEYMLGPIEFLALFKPTPYGVEDTNKRNWKDWLVHEPEEFPSELRIELLPDFQLSDPSDGTIIQADGTVGNRVFTLDYSRGRQIGPLPREIHAHLQVRMSNFAPEAPIRILNYVLAVESQGGK